MDLRGVRNAVERPQSAAPPVTATRDELSKLIAAKIQQTSSSEELSEFTEEVLPELEKFLESPEEKRLRRIRTGSMVSFIGLGIAVGFLIAGLIADDDLIAAAVGGFITLFIGLALVVNGVYFTVPGSKPQLIDRGAKPEPGDEPSTTNELLMPPTANQEFSSVTENTTRQLKNKDLESSAKN